MSIDREEPGDGPSDLPVIFVVGPTGVGKTRLAVDLALRFNGEVINSDSRQVYRNMDIGTAKPSPGERAQVRHHLLDILEPDKDFDLATFLSFANAAVREIQVIGKIPVVAGGTGQYVWALAEGWQVPKVPPDPEFRRMKQQEAERNGPKFVFRQLQEADPDRAAQVDPQNLRRVIRALEVHRSKKISTSGAAERVPPSERGLVIGLTMERQALYRIIDDRVERMLIAGLVEEVRMLHDSGYRLGQGPLASPGYREVGQYLTGEISLDEAVRRTKFQTHRLVRRQYTWFKLGDERICWLDAADPGLDDQAARKVEEFLSGQAHCGKIGTEPTWRPGDEIHQDAGHRQ